MFLLVFYALCIICAVLYFYSKNREKVVYTSEFSEFQRLYLVGYLLASAGDWLQGPHVYALYESYKLSKHDIELLFVAGFGSSVFFGTFIGSVADKLGRRNNCLLYGVLYSAACLTKHFADFRVLLVGRLLGGVATSILFSAFESWLVFEHNRRALPADLLGALFSNATLGNSLVAILAGVLAQFAADRFGFVAPFDLAFLVLTLMGLYVVCRWSENYGDSHAPLSHSFAQAWKTLRSDRKVLYLGVMQSLFEGSMYTFVLEWTPALSGKVEGNGTSNASAHAPADAIPHGYIFASFMVAVMIGSSLFRLLSARARPESFMRPVLLLAALCLAPPVLLPGDQRLALGGFVGFEVCVGVFWPAVGFMRSVYVPEEARSTVMNFFRVPLNLIVVGVLVQNLPMRAIFLCCVGFLALAFAAQCALCRARFAVAHHN